MSEKVKSVASRFRGPNFTKEEQILLFKIVETYAHIIESKKTDAIKQIDKQNAWKKVTEVFNANTKGAPRTIDNLMSCYRNAKSKLKKERSEAKMLQQDSTQKDAFLNALNENGKDWEKISSEIKAPVEVCVQSFDELQKELKTKETMHKKIIMGTGGGPPPVDNDDPLNTIKKLIDPQIDGMFTIYDGDALLMDQFQESCPEEDRVQPIELTFINDHSEKNDVQKATLQNYHRNTSNYQESPSVLSNDEPSMLQSPKAIVGPSRTDILRKRKSFALANKENHEQPPLNKKKSVNDSFRTLSDEKIELVRLQKLSLQMELEHKRKLYAMELDEIVKQNKFKEEMRQKELLLMDLKIKNASQQ